MMFALYQNEVLLSNRPEINNVSATSAKGFISTSLIEHKNSSDCQFSKFSPIANRYNLGFFKKVL